MRRQNTEEDTGRRQVAPRATEPKSKRKRKVPAVPRAARTKIKIPMGKRQEAHL
jgi:hypothetical protein